MEHLEPLKPLWIALSFLGDAAFLLFFFSTLFLWAIYKKKPYLEQIYNTIFLLGIGIVVSYLLKVLVGRSRPLYLQDNIGPFSPLLTSIMRFTLSHLPMLYLLPSFLFILLKESGLRLYLYSLFRFHGSPYSNTI